MKELLRWFFRESRATRQEIVLRVEAREALAMLALENERNCDRVLKRERVAVRLVDNKLFHDPQESVRFQWH